jgi:penicillin-insensitive murein DD-endopeptidase
VTRWLAWVLLSPLSALAEDSICFGTVANGRVEEAVKLPSEGPNFQPYTSLGVTLGRTHVHSTVRDIVTDAYAALEKSVPGRVYVYGETGWASGGRIRPHRTHQNGLSVDFMVPVLDEEGRSVPLPGSLTNRYGYDIEFDRHGRYEGLTIDFGALAEHLYQLDRAARRRGIGLRLVIFDDVYLPALFATKRGSYLRANLPFMKARPWVRHDEHYHVDFAVKCRALE